MSILEDIYRNDNLKGSGTKLTARAELKRHLKEASNPLVFSRGSNMLSGPVSLVKRAACDRREYTETPTFIKHQVRAITKKGLPKSRAYAVAVGQSQNVGNLEPGTKKLTAKGKTLERKHALERK